MNSWNAVHQFCLYSDTISESWVMKEPFVSCFSSLTDLFLSSMYTVFVIFIMCCFLIKNLSQTASLLVCSRTKMFLILDLFFFFLMDFHFNLKIYFTFISCLIKSFRWLVLSNLRFHLHLLVLFASVTCHPFPDKSLNETSRLITGLCVYWWPFLFIYLNKSTYSCYTFASKCL